ncbi:hypothetical protein SB775_27965, partial [Peribacillus sp. SIMBA_075]|uniref:hypothetical protein n=1 Tax=Peribacillus sp. SIMBA_075 TaxID=3085813 RepID=UPI003979B13E
TEKMLRILGILAGGVTAQLREKSETASKVVDSLRHLKGGRLRACFVFFTPSQQVSQRPSLFSPVSFGQPFYYFALS